MSTYRVVIAETNDQMRKFYTLRNLVDFADELASQGVNLSTVTIRTEGSVEHRILESRYPADPEPPPF